MPIVTVQEIKLTAPPTGFTDVENTQLADIFGSPLVKRYLQALIWNSIKDAAELPLTEVIEDPTGYALKQAYMKGNLSILYTLNSIQKPAPRANTQPREPD